MYCPHFTEKEGKAEELASSVMQLAQGMKPKQCDSRDFLLAIIPYRLAKTTEMPPIKKKKKTAQEKWTLGKNRKWHKRENGIKKIILFYMIMLWMAFS